MAFGGRRKAERIADTRDDPAACDTSDASRVHRDIRETYRTSKDRYGIPI
jgi:hypothetical protein